MTCSTSPSTSRGRGRPKGYTKVVAAAVAAAATDRGRVSPAATAGTIGVDRGKGTATYVVNSATGRGRGANTAVGGGADRVEELVLQLLVELVEVEELVLQLLVKLVEVKELMLLLLIVLVQQEEMVSVVLTKVEGQLIKDLEWLEWGCFIQRMVLKSSIQKCL
ncbi:hypothetical protein P3L10_001700 [Capsicum annuum]